jgi:hypothetical protein
MEAPTSGISKKPFKELSTRGQFDRRKRFKKEVEQQASVFQSVVLQAKTKLLIPDEMASDIVEEVCSALLFESAVCISLDTFVYFTNS